MPDFSRISKAWSTMSSSRMDVAARVRNWPSLRLSHTKKLKQ